MGKFMFVFRGGEKGESGENALSPEAMQAHMQKWRTWMEGLGQSGAFIGGDPLNPEGSVVSGLGGSIVTDGPFAEGKELVGGYVMINSDSLADATEVAKGCPILESEGTVEVREVKDMSAM